MTARIICLSTALMGAAVGACLPVASEDKAQATAANTDVPLEIAINQFPGGYQGRWATNAARCADDPESSPDVISLQGKLVKLHESIGTMTAGKRQTSKTMEAEFEFVGEGEKWNKVIAFAMSEDRKELVRTDKDDGASYRYVQCPKLMAG
jgi:hypothetical protein